MIRADRDIFDQVAEALDADSVTFLENPFNVVYKSRSKLLATFGNEGLTYFAPINLLSLRRLDLAHLLLTNLSPGTLFLT